MNRRVLFWLAMVVAALGLGVGASAAGSQPEPSIKVQPDEARPGETVAVSGECWGGCDSTPLAEEVTLTLLDGEVEIPDLAGVTDQDLDKNGDFELNVDLPDDLDKGEYKLRAESPEGLRATDKLFVGRRDSSDDGNDGDGDNGDQDNKDRDEEDERDRASADADDCEVPPLASQPPAPAAAGAQAPASDEPGQAYDCDDVAPAATAPAGQDVLGESQDSDGSDGASSRPEPAGERGDDGDDSDDGDGDDGGGKGKRAGKNADGDSDEDDDDSGGGGGGKGDDRGQDGAPAGGPPAETVRAAAGPAPEDIRQAVPWAIIAVLGALFAIGLGATYHVVGRWAPDPADVG